MTKRGCGLMIFATLVASCDTAPALPAVDLARFDLAVAGHPDARSRAVAEAIIAMRPESELQYVLVARLDGLPVGREDRILQDPAFRSMIETAIDTHRALGPRAQRRWGLLGGVAHAQDDCATAVGRAVRYMESKLGPGGTFIAGCLTRGAVGCVGAYTSILGDQIQASVSGDSSMSGARAVEACAPRAAPEPVDPMRTECAEDPACTTLDPDPSPMPDPRCPSWRAPTACGGACCGIGRKCCSGSCIWGFNECSLDAGSDEDAGSVGMDAGTCMTPVGPETCTAATRCLSCGALGGCFDPAVTCCGGDQLAAATDVCLDCGAGPRVYPRGSTCDEAGTTDGGRDAGVDGGMDAGADAGRDASVDGGRDAGCDVTLPPGFACPMVVCPPEPEPTDGGAPLRFAPDCDISLTCDCPLGYACLSSSTPRDGGGLRGYRTCCLWDGTRALGGSCPTTFRCPAGYARIREVTTDHTGSSIDACLCYSGATWDFVGERALERLCSLPM